MKQHLLRILGRFLGSSARSILRRYRPTVIGVTGTVGKTTTKNLIAHVLDGHVTVRASQKNYNNELGLPLTIIDAETGGRSLWKWLRAAGRAKWLRWGPRIAYPEMLILEMGIDHPGDMDALTAIVQPTTAVVTAVTSVHMAFFPSIDGLADEKMRLAAALPRNGLCIVNGDNEHIRSRLKALPGTHITYGTSEDCTLRLVSFRIVGQSDPGTPAFGSVMIVEDKDSKREYNLPGIVGKCQALDCLPAIIIGKQSGLSLGEISDRLVSFRLPAGRLQILPGVNGSILLDDSYNSSPAAVVQALETLSSLPAKGRRIAILGDMAELGESTEQAHADAGRFAARHADSIIGVGEYGHTVTDAASNEKSGIQVQAFDDVHAAAHALLALAGEGDIILVKGSQAARMERVSKVLLADATTAQDVLVRQTPEWR